MPLACKLAAIWTVEALDDELVYYLGENEQGKGNDETGVRTCRTMGLLGDISWGDNGERSIGQCGEAWRAGLMQSWQKLCAQVLLVIGSTKGMLREEVKYL